MVTDDHGVTAIHLQAQVDHLPVSQLASIPSEVCKKIYRRPRLGRLRVMAGPEWHDDLLPFLRGPWVVDARSNTTAIRLQTYASHRTYRWLSFRLACSFE